MAYAIEWDPPTERYYQHGLDRGVAYIPGVGAVAWNGLTGFGESEEVASASVIYRDGQIILADAEPGDFTGSITAMFYPDELSDCIGIPRATDGFYVDNQKPKRFSFSYRTLIGSGTEGDMFGYQIHLVYNAVAIIGSRQRTGIGSSVEPVEFSFSVVCTPVSLSGFRPTAHYIIDTRDMSPSVLAQVEESLYGVSGASEAQMEDPTFYFDLMNFGSAIQVSRNVPAGTFTVDASSSKISVNPDGTFTLYDINSTAPDVNGQYVISTGGNTTVV